MSKKVLVSRFGQVHYHGGCNVCAFSVGISTKETPRHADVRNAIRRHVRQTGHACWIEAGSHTNYYLDEKES